MTDQQVARGRRAVVCLGWRWMPGMLGCMASNPKSTIRIAHAGAGLLHHPNGGVWSDDGVIPVLDDPATLGCITTLAREALGEPLAHVVPFPTHVSDPIFGGLVPALWWAISTTADSAARFFPNDDGPSWAMAGPAPEDAWLAALEAAGRR